jgi:hypothetical protein
MKTVKEAAHGYFRKGQSGFVPAADTESAFIAGAEFALRWISVEEELPKAGETVLVMNEAGDISTAIYSKNYFAVDFHGMNSGDVICWRRIEL